MAMTPVVSGGSISSLKFTELANAVNAEIDRRGGGTKVGTTYSGSITHGDYNAIKNGMKNAAIPYDTGLADVVKDAIIYKEDINNLITKIENAAAVCLCNCNYCTCDCNYCTCDCNYCTCDCNYCTCDCNYCTCDCNYSCTCNCNYSDERLKTNIVYM